jgi:hypothetical protein
MVNISFHPTPPRIRRNVDSLSTGGYGSLRAVLKEMVKRNIFSVQRVIRNE